MLKKNKSLLPALLLLAGFFVAGSCKEPNKNITTKEITPSLSEPANPYAVVDKSPMDISYYPVNYPQQLMNKNDSAGLTARVIYSRPQKMGRTIFSNEPPPKCIQQYGAYWRLGANEATEIEFFKEVHIQGKKIAKGRYIIYCIPNPTQWMIIFNSNLFSFGLHQDTAQDICKFEIPVQQTNDNIEFFTMVFQKSAIGADLIMTWGGIKAVLPIEF